MLASKRDELREQHPVTLRFLFLQEKKFLSQGLYRTLLTNDGYGI